MQFLMPISGINSAHAQDKPTEEEAIRSSFQSYREAILQGDGAKAVNFISQKTLDYYAELRDLALYGEAPRVMALDLMDRLMIISLRHRISVENLQKMNETQLFIYSVQNGWIGKESIQRLKLDGIIVESRTAKASYRFDNKKTGLSLLFYKQTTNGQTTDGQKNGWALDLTNVLRTGNAALEQTLKNQGRDENEFIFAAIAKVTGIEPPQGIWHPPLYRK